MTPAIPTRARPAGGFQRTCEQATWRATAALRWPRGLAGRTLLVGLLAGHLPILALLAAMALAPPVLRPHLLVLAVAATMAGGLVVGLLLLSTLRCVLQLAAVMEGTAGRREPGQGRRRGKIAQTADLPELMPRLHGCLLHLERRASNDWLTGIYNRRAGELRLTQSLAATRRHGVPFMLALLDIDALKSINDGHGHHVGDAAITHAASMLRRSLRSSDWIARWGGDELLLGIHAPAEEADPMGRRLTASVAEEPIDAGGVPVAVTVSVGIAVANREERARELLRRADAALYRAKERGGNRHIVAPPGTAA